VSEQVIFNGLAITQSLVTALLKGTPEGLEMAGVVPVAIGASSMAQSRRAISVMVGLVGDSNGTITLNMSKRAMLYLTGKLLFEDQEEMNEENVDAICEIGNMVAGCTKEALQGSEFRVENISVPSMIFGANYDVHYTRGIDTCTVEFSLEDLPIVNLDDRIFTVTISLLRRLAK
jgi:CheY-specific phosphatase CheX